ncbi:hypothetical protein SCAR479_05008 [Seiridium cardinale]|uniref:J domain-containing protein n=1 Tax=Seiridium cardinale TaxID=138064 RepID=A0ABR2Y4Y2_9PEZI
MAEKEITEDYYAILEVSPKATDVEIKKSYRRLALLKHPDKNPDKPEATAEFQQINTAYGCLSDPKKRAIYDQCRTQVRAEFDRSARAGEHEVNLLQKKIIHLKRVLKDLIERHNGLSQARAEAEHDLKEVIQELSLSSKVSGDRSGKRLGLIVKKLQEQIQQLDTQIQDEEFTILETELHLAFLTFEARRQQWPARAPQHQTARQEEAAKMQADQRRRMAREEKDIAKQRQMAREAQQKAAKAKKEAQQSDRRAWEEAKAKIESCSHGTWWNKINGSHACKNCYKSTARGGAFSCPDCALIVCKGCRNTLNSRKNKV